MMRGETPPAAQDAPARAPRGRRRHSPRSSEQRPTYPVAFVDASALVALADRDDAAHGPALAAYRQLVANGYRLFTTNYAVAEAYDLLAAGVGSTVARRWLRDNQLAVYHADEEDERRAREKLLETESHHPLSLIDAINLVVMERLGVTDAFAVDPNLLAATT